MKSNLIPISLYPEHIVVWINYLQILEIRQKDYHKEDLQLPDERKQEKVCSVIAMTDGCIYVCTESPQKIDNLIRNNNA